MKSKAVATPVSGLGGGHSCSPSGDRHVPKNGGKARLSARNLSERGELTPIYKAHGHQVNPECLRQHAAVGLIRWACLCANLWDQVEGAA